MITTLAGGVGAARLLTGLVQVVAPEDLVAVVNVGDDLRMHGLHISPDLDTITYTLAGAVNLETGWGLGAETWNAMGTLERLGGDTWFQLGDRDLGTHLYRTQRLAEGAPLSAVTAEIVAAWELVLTLLPVTDDELRTRVTIAEEGEVSFQEYFVGRRHSVVVEGVRFDGAEQSRAAPGVLAALEGADVIVIAPSNPLVSIAPVLAVPEVGRAVRAARHRAVAVSPIVAGAALKGPADRMLAELGHEPSVVGVARIYRDIAATLVIDEADSALAPAVEDEGLRCVVAPTIMHTPTAAAELASTVLAAAGRPLEGRS